MSQQIPILNLQEQYQKLAPELEAAVLSVLRSGHYILGELGVKLGEEIAFLCGCRHGIGVANGTDALHLALWCLDIGPGDEVITTPFTFAATVEAIAMRGAKPVFVDVEESTFNIDTKLIEKAITASTKAILPVHLYGLPADMDPILDLAQKYSLRIIEDNAQAIGAKYKRRPTGSLSDLACISFYPTKNLGACGDAGMIVTNDDILAERLRVLRAHGMKKRYLHDEVGVNSRLDEIQAAILLTKLPYLDTWNAERRTLASLYDEALEGCPNIVRPKTVSHDGTEHVWHQYTIRVLESRVLENANDVTNNPLAGPTRDAVITDLAKRGVGSMCYYPVPLHLQAAFQYLGYKAGDFPLSEKMGRQVLSLPMYPELTKSQLEQVAFALKQATADLDPFAGKVVPTQAIASV